jgi:hypothetical protein
MSDDNLAQNIYRHVSTDKVHLPNTVNYAYNSRLAKADEYGFFGGIAQLGERLHGMQEVSGSIPLISTKTLLYCLR